MSNLVLLLVVVFLAASGGISVKIGLQSFSPYTFIFLRYFFAFLIILPLLKNHSLFNVNKSKKLYLASFFAVMMVVLFAFGVRFSTIISASIITVTTPIMVGIISHLFLKVRYKKNEIIGAFLGLFGALFVVLLPLFKGGQSIEGSFVGNLLLVGSSLSFALYSIFSHPLQNKFSKKEITANFFLLAWVTQLLLILVELFSGKPLLVAPLTAAPLAALLFAVINAVAFYILFQRLIARAGSLYASFGSYLNPIASTFLAVILLNEKLTLSQFAGAAITFLGVWIYGRKGKK